MSAVTVAEIKAAVATIAPVARRTPVLPAREVSRRVGATVRLKAECLQATGSFKVRGAFNAIAALDDAQLKAGVVAASAGNHAQAVAAAAARANAKADLFMPAAAPLAKLAAVRRHGGDIHLVEGSFDDAAEEARRFAADHGSTVVAPFDDPQVIAGQGTVGIELAEQAPVTRLVVVPIGGGALAAGIAIAIKERLPGSRVVGVRADLAARSGGTICDGIDVKRPGAIAGPLVEQWVDEVVTVSDDEAAEAMVLLLERSKLVVEGAGAVGVAALLAGRIEPPQDGEVCAVLSGGNVDPTRLAECIALGETVSGRRMVLSVVLPDRPGALAGLLQVVAEQGANVIDVEHVREGLDLHVGETAITLVMQTRGPEHSAELSRVIEGAGFKPRTTPLESS